MKLNTTVKTRKNSTTVLCCDASVIACSVSVLLSKLNFSYHIVNEKVLFLVSTHITSSLNKNAHNGLVVAT